MRFSGFVNNYNNKVFNRIKSNRDLIVESFTRYYGEKYRKLIENKFDSVIFYSFISENTHHAKDYMLTCILQKKLMYSIRIFKLLGIDVSNVYYKKYVDKNFRVCVEDVKTKKGFILDKKMNMLFGDSNLINSKSNIMHFNELSCNEQINFARKFYNIINVENTHIKKMQHACIYSNNIKYLITNLEMSEYKCKKYIELCDYSDSVISKYDFNPYNRIVGSNSEYNNYARDFLNEELKVRKNSCAIYTTNSDDEIFDFILLPILLTTDSILFHELNHQIVTSDLVIIDDSYKYYTIHKSGISNSVFEKINFEELINQKTQIKIRNIFKELGGKIFDYEEEDFGQCCCYDLFFPLIDSFFEKYEDILKDVRISTNHNLLYKYVDKDLFLKYRDYVDLIVSTKINDYDTVPVTLNEYQNCCDMVDKMDKVKKLKK